MNIRKDFIKFVIIFLLFSLINIFLDPNDWPSKIDQLKKDFLGVYFDPCGYQKIYLENYNIIIPNFNKNNYSLIYGSIYTKSILAYFETGVYKSHNNKLFKGFRIWNDVFMFEWSDWHRLNSDFDLMTLDYYSISIQSTKYDNYNSRFNYLIDADNFPLIARKDGDMINIFKQYKNGKEEKYFFSFRLED